MGVAATVAPEDLGPQGSKPDQKVGLLGGPFGSTCFQKFRASTLPPKKC